MPGMSTVSTGSPRPTRCQGSCGGSGAFGVLLFLDLDFLRSLDMSGARFVLRCERCWGCSLLVESQHSAELVQPVWLKNRTLESPCTVVGAHLGGYRPINAIQRDQNPRNALGRRLGFGMPGAFMLAVQL